VSRIPVSFEATYVGLRPGGEFKPADSKTPVQYPARLKFLYQSEGGDAELVEISGSQIDRVHPPVDHAAIGLGQRVSVEGMAVIQDRGSDKDSYLQITTFEVL
jgi:hypothetical protein